MNDNDKRKLSHSTSDLSPSVSHMEKRQNITGMSPLEANTLSRFPPGAFPGQSFVPESPQSKIASILQT